MLRLVGAVSDVCIMDHTRQPRSNSTCIALQQRIADALRVCLLIDLWPCKVGKFHSHRHNKHCKFSPQNNKKYDKRLKNVNKPICEKTFSWFRGYARVLNEMRPLQNRFLVLNYVKEHNEIIDKTEKPPAYLNQCSVD